MTEQEKINAELKLKINLQDTRFSLTVQELRQQREELKEQREDIRRLNDKMDSIVNQIHDTWRQTMLGVGGLIIAVGALLFAALK